MRHDQSNVDHGESAVVGLVVVLGVKSKDHVPPIPEAGSDVDLFTAMQFEIGWQAGRNVVSAKAEAARLGPVIKVIGDVRHHHPFLTPLMG